MTSSSQQTSRQDGFTFTELAVVILIITILLAISIPVFIGAQRRARDRAAQSLAREVLTAAKTLFQLDENYLAATTTSLAEAEPSLNLVPGAQTSNAPRIASVDSPDAVTFVTAVWSASGRCFYLKDLAVPVSGGTRFASKISDGSDCAAGAPPAAGQFTDQW